jgi:hypothetical protein
MDLLDQMRPALTPRELPHVLSAAAALRRPPDRVWCVAMMARAHGCMDGFTAHGLAVMIWAVGRAGMRTRADWAERFLSALGERMDGGSCGRRERPRELARALALAMHGIGSTGSQPGGAWMGRWLAAVHGLRRHLAPRDVACLLVGLQRLRCARLGSGRAPLIGCLGRMWLAALQAAGVPCDCGCCRAPPHVCRRVERYFGVCT